MTSPSDAPRLEAVRVCSCLRAITRQARACTTWSLHSPLALCLWLHSLYGISPLSSRLSTLQAISGAATQCNRHLLFALAQVLLHCNQFVTQRATVLAIGKDLKADFLARRHHTQATLGELYIQQYLISTDENCWCLFSTRWAELTMWCNKAAFWFSSANSMEKLLHVPLLLPFGLTLWLFAFAMVNTLDFMAPGMTYADYTLEHLCKTVLTVIIMSPRPFNEACFS